ILASHPYLYIALRWGPRAGTILQAVGADLRHRLHFPPLPRRKPRNGPNPIRRLHRWDEKNGHSRTVSQTWSGFGSAAIAGPGRKRMQKSVGKKTKGKQC